MNIVNFKLSCIAASIVLTHTVAASVSAEESDNAEITSTQEKQIEVISIFGERNQLSTTTGSAFIIDEKQLDQFEFDDIHRVLQSVPGVYIREEDGYGLRPNIGLRGATSERSSKVAIMEDGVLIAPAPYAAPAAYYFPLISRMTRVEVIKGPSAIKYGPNTVGGAINMISRPIVEPDEEPEGMLDISLGENHYQKAHGYYSTNTNKSDIGNVGFLIEGITTNADGFKKIDGGGDTGFNKNELIIKASFSPESSDSYQLWQFKGGYSDEVSNETYLGLTDADVNQDPNRRYAASKNDKMEWEHYQFQLSHFIELNNDTSLYTQAYRRDFERSWDRFNSFNTNRSMQTILMSPDTGLNSLFMQVLTGQRDSLTSQESIIFTLNDRKYYSQGLESKLLWDGEWLDADIALDVGLRVHQDSVERNHSSELYRMQSATLVPVGEPEQITTKNQDTATAVASYVNANIDFGLLNVTAGMRLEYIEGEANDLLNGVESTHSDLVVMPGVGAFYQITSEFGTLFGINKGYVPNSPGQKLDIAPEESWNYELGFRYSSDSIQAEMTGFYNDYSNLKGNCTFSSGCTETLDQEFNGGEVDIYGVEASFSSDYDITDTISVPIKIAYTYTQAEFQNGFQSSFSQWGTITAGDGLPYLPENQLSVELALQHEDWRLAFLYRYVDKMQEAAGTSTELTDVWTDALQQIDVSAWYQFNPSIKAYFKVDNISDEASIVSRRPFGARPGKPRQAFVGVKYSF